MHRLLQLRTGLRGLRRTPGFTSMALLTLALGIGLSTAVFTVADALLLRRLPVHDQNRLVVMWGETRDGRSPNFPFFLTTGREFAQSARSLDRAAFVSYYGAVPALVRDGDQVSRLSRSLVSGDFFAVLGAQPVLGRAASPRWPR